MLLKLCGRYGVHESPQPCVATMASMCPLPCAVLMVSMCHSNCVPPMVSMRRSLGILGIHGLDTMETNGSMESKEIKGSMESWESVSPWIVFKESMDSNQSLEYNQHRVTQPSCALSFSPLFLPFLAKRPPP